MKSKFLETKIETVVYQKLWAIAKAVVRGKLTALSARTQGQWMH